MNQFNLRRKKILRILGRLIPYKGNVAWEMEIGPIVIQWAHGKGSWGKKANSFILGKLYIWKDPFWNR